MAKEYGSSTVTTAAVMEKEAKELIARTLGAEEAAYTDLEGLIDHAQGGGRLDPEEKAIARSIGWQGTTRSEGLN